MSKIKVAGNELIVTSSISEEVFEKVLDHNSSALALVNKEGDETFRVGTGSINRINQFGITFNGVHNGQLYLARTLDAKVAAMEKDAQAETIAKEYGKAFASLLKVEEQVAKAVATINADVAAVKATIEVVEL